MNACILQACHSNPRLFLITNVKPEILCVIYRLVKSNSLKIEKKSNGFYRRVLLKTLQCPEVEEIAKSRLLNVKFRRKFSAYTFSTVHLQAVYEDILQFFAYDPS
jgi:hypothetical protein